MNLFVYGTLGSRENLTVTCDIIDYDYIKGFKLSEIIIEGETFLCAKRSYSDDIISGRILLDIQDSIGIFDDWEGDDYKREVVITEVNKIECNIYLYSS